MTTAYLKRYAALLDAEDADCLANLARMERCQQRIIPKGDCKHYIYCGGYFAGSDDEKATQLPDGRFLCKKHRRAAERALAKEKP